MGDFNVNTILETNNNLKSVQDCINNINIFFPHMVIHYV